MAKRRKVMTVKKRDALVERRVRRKISLKSMTAFVTVDESTLWRWEQTRTPERLPMFKWAAYELALRLAIDAASTKKE